MPNYVKNRISYEGDPAQIRRMLLEIADDSLGIGSIDFNKVIPMPPSLSIEASSRTEDGLRKYREYVSAKEAHGDLSEYEAYRQSHPEEWELGKTAYENLYTYGFKTWYEWCTAVWGTKWPAMEQNVSAASDREFSFETAWSFPHGIVSQLSERYPEIVFTARWADEDLGNNCGGAVYKAGNLQNLYCPDQLTEAIDLALEVWESDPRDWGLALVTDRDGNRTYRQVSGERECEER